MRYIIASLTLFSVSTAVFAQDARFVPASADGSRTLYICSARTLLGKRFSATGENKELTQEKALQQCESYGFRCYRTGCTETSTR